MTDSYVTTKVHTVTTDIGKVDVSERPRQVEVDAEDAAHIRAQMARHQSEAAMAHMIHIANAAARDKAPATRGLSRYRWIIAYIRRQYHVDVTTEDVAFHTSAPPQST